MQFMAPSRPPRSRWIRICVSVFALALPLTLAPSGKAEPVLVLSEIMAANNGPVRDEDGDASDWIEVHNPGTAAVSLAGWHLTDDPINPGKWTFPATNLAPGGFLLVFASGKDRALAGEPLHTSFALDSSGEFLGLVKPDGVRIAHAYSPKFPPQISQASYGMEILVATNTFVQPGAAAKWRVPQAGDGISGWAESNFNDASWSIGTLSLGYGGEPVTASAAPSKSAPFLDAGDYGTDIGTEMKNVNSSVLVRIPFIIPEEEMPELDSLTLSVKYADGFVAYLNGHEIARRNAPASLDWNSTAVTNRALAEVAVAEAIDVTPFLSALQEGANVLAIQGLNASATNTHFLLAPSLLGQKVQLGPDRYFAAPTPSAPNGGGALGLVADTKFSVNRGFYQAPIAVEISCATPGAEIRFTTNGTEPGMLSGTLYSAPISINDTTVIRAVASKPGWLPSDVDTHTYVFLENVLTQNTSSATNRGFPASWPGVSADYAMDPAVVNTNLDAMVPALRALPSVFITSSVSNLFNSTAGIYANPLQSGPAWERAVSVEMIDTNGLTEFQENAGLRIQGGIYFRSFSMTQKKSFRVLFKSVYGAPKLKCDLFHEPGSAKEFDGFVLRAGANDGYAWGEGGTTVQFTRDEFGRRLQLAMGNPAPRGLFVHLYLNGLYWGLYNLVERPNEDFSATYLGGEPEEWDACSGGEFKNGGPAAFNRWNEFTFKTSSVKTYADYQALQGNNPDGSRNPALPPYFNKANYLDYMILNMWAGNWDWPNKNFWFGYSTNSGAGYQFYTWDFENVIGNNRSRSPLDMVSPRASVAGQWVGIPHARLKGYSEYQLDFADRVQRLFFGGGLLTSQVLTNRYRQLADRLDPAILAESARWGDDNHRPAYGMKEWRAERDWILTNYLPRRADIVLNQFRAGLLYPSVAAPVFNQWGGAVADGFQATLTHTNAAGTIYYTLDGSDPRQPGTGDVSGSAIPYENEQPIVVHAPTLIRARVQNGVAWSAVAEAMFYPPRDLSRLALTELMYHAPDAGLTSGSEFEFLELMNTGTNVLDLSGLTFTEGLTFTFTRGTTLEPGAFCVLVGNPAAFAQQYPGIPIAGTISGNLDNGGETLTLADPFGEKVISVRYEDQPPWPAAADGTGLSLQRIQLMGNGNEPLDWIAAVPTPGRTLGSEDADGDGLPDAWEVENGTLVTIPDADGDPDGDGLTTGQEYLAGTRPNDPMDVLQILPRVRKEGGLELGFLAIRDHTYSVIYKDTLSEINWSTLTDIPSGSADRMVFVSDDPPPGFVRFYRLITPAQP